MTTQWQSMFDAGPCEVRVRDWNYVIAWSGVLGLGQASPQFAVGSDTYQVAVDANGVVTLSTVAGIPGGMAVFVYPQYDTSALQTQVAGISAWQDGTAPPQSGTGIARSDWSSVSLVFSTPAATPSSATFVAHAPQAGGAYVGVSVDPLA